MPEKTYTYRLPDGRDDTPDENGQHTATVNVMHSAEQLARFPGCKSCRSIAEHGRDSHNAGMHGHYGDWDAATETFGTSSYHSVAECPDGFIPPDWRDGRCYCAQCEARRAAIGF